MNILAAILNWINTQLGSQIPLLPLKWRDLIDVALILVAVRYIYTFFVGTRTQLLLRGLAIFFAVWGLAVSLQLTGLSLLFRVLADVGLIAIVVLFQSELREALERIGRSGLFVNAPELRAETLDEIVEAVESMASRRVGALIVIEQRTGLGDYAERGTILDAKVTSDLLRTIFYPGTRLHDLATLIRGDRVLAAGSLLPLADESKAQLAREYGSRHRAAVGISERSDAIAIVVSEETGRIALAQGGILHPDLSPIELRNQLTNLYFPQKEVRPADGAKADGAQEPRPLEASSLGNQPAQGELDRAEPELAEPSKKPMV